MYLQQLLLFDPDYAQEYSLLLVGDHWTVGVTHLSRHEVGVTVSQITPRINVTADLDADWAAVLSDELRRQEVESAHYPGSPGFGSAFDLALTSSSNHRAISSE